MPGPRRLLPVGGCAEQSVAVWFHLEPAPFSRPSRQRLPWRVHAPLGFALEQHSPAIFEPICDCLLCHLTSKVVSFVTVFPPWVAVTTIRHVPGVVLVPTTHDQDTFPDASAARGASSGAVLGPDM